MIKLAKAIVARIKKPPFETEDAMKLPFGDLAYVVLLNDRRKRAQMVFSVLIIGSGLVTFVVTFTGPVVLATAGCYLIAGLCLLDTVVVSLHLRHGRRFIQKAIERNKKRAAAAEQDKKLAAEAATSALMSRWNGIQP